MEVTALEVKSTAEKIKELRLTRGLTLEQVANEVGVGKSTVRKWETGMIANMRNDKIKALAKALGSRGRWFKSSHSDQTKTRKALKTLGFAGFRVTAIKT